MKKWTKHFSFLDLLLLFLFLFTQQQLSSATDTINTTHSLRNGELLVSSVGTFELGFFNPESSTNWYIGIWFRNITVRTVVWVANRQTPLRNNTGILTVIQPGRLIILDESNNTLWSSNNNTSRLLQNPVAQLLDSGNLVLRDASDDQTENYLWQSFDYLTDTFLADMNFGLNHITGVERYLTSWKSSDDPSPGEYTLHIEPAGYPQAIGKRAGVPIYRVGPWNGLRFSGEPNLIEDKTYTYMLYINQNSVYFREQSIDRSVISRFTLNPNGVGQRWIWVNRTQGWIHYLSIPADICDTYRICGPYGSCNIVNSPMCGCLDKFAPSDPQGWMRSDWSNGCVRKKPLNCTAGDGFRKYSGIKLPDSRNSWYNESMSLKACEAECLRKCSCTAYTTLDISTGSGCLLWFGDLLDIRVLSAEGQDIYVRVASSEIGSEGMKRKIIIVSSTIVGLVLLGLSFILYIWKAKKNGRNSRRGGNFWLKLEQETGMSNESPSEGLELPLFKFSTISKATDNFSSDNKLGEGGYGPVYKGSIQEGLDIAVKRLSRTSLQGLDEFKNEVNCIARLQHRNLVKLLGCCIQGEEKLLIYEYLPNKSLDSILFDERNRTLLDWPQRFHIVNGIARGLMYLHQDSRLRIIHRDLKASNILLDKDMNPKISDFGLAKIFVGNETEDRTSRVVGTYGYMSPEYAMRGRFSVKSDVFSFGVLVLEIVSGKRNSEYYPGKRHANLLGQAWILYKEGRSLELLDTYLQDKANPSEALWLIQVGLLCVQQSPDERPTMTTVVTMLESERVMHQPNQPGFFLESDAILAEIARRDKPGNSANEITITMMEGR